MTTIKIENAEASYLKEQELQDIIKTMHVMVHNLEFIPINTYYSKNLDVKEMYKDQKFLTQDDEVTIVVDVTNQYDEFWIDVPDGQGGFDTLNYIEVVTLEVAKSNDLDFDITQENIDEYELGKIYSLYTQLGETNYYYREL